MYCCEAKRSQQLHPWLNKPGERRGSGVRSAGTIQSDRSCRLDLLPQDLRRSLVAYRVPDTRLAHSSPCGRTCCAATSLPTALCRPRAPMALVFSLQGHLPGGRGALGRYEDLAHPSFGMAGRRSPRWFPLNGSNLSTTHCVFCPETGRLGTSRQSPAIAPAIPVCAGAFHGEGEAEPATATGGPRWR